MIDILVVKTENEVSAVTTTVIVKNRLFYGKYRTNKVIVI